LKRIVILSSCAAIAHSSPDALITVTEENWNDEPVRICKEKGAEAGGIDKYVASKVLSERVVWEWYDAHRNEIEWDVCVLCPPWVFGPPIHEVGDIKTINPSWKILHSAITKGEFASFNGDDPAKVPGHGWADVRDVGEVCVGALVDVEEAGGERIIVCNGVESPFVWDDWIEAVKGGKVTGGVRSDRRSGVHFETSKEKRIFGMKWRGMAETQKGLLESFEERGWN
jgi:nucleoside-diphosphate-sugar epimerase